MSNTKPKAIIIGAGIGGLATANLLAKAGYEVEVFEKNKNPGGRADTATIKGFTFDQGPSWYLMPEIFEHHFKLMGEDINKHLDLIRLEPAYKVFFENNKPITITSDIAHDAETFEAIEKGAGKALVSYVNKGKQIYYLSLKHFLYTNFTSAGDFLKLDVLRNGPKMLKLSFMPIHNYVNRFVRDKRLQQILEYPMVFLGTSPFIAPAIYSLMSALDFHQGVYYPKNGMYTIITALVRIGKKNGVKYHYNRDVKHIIIENKKAVGIELVGGKKIHADIVISNSDVHYTETSLLSREHQSYPQSYWDKLQPGPSALLMYLGVKGKIDNLEHHNLILVDSWQENFESIYDTKTLPKPASIYVCKPSGLDASTAPKGDENLFVLVPLPPNLDLPKAKLEKIADSYLSQIAKNLSVPDLKKRLIVKELFGPNDFKSKFYSWQGTALGASHILSQSAMFRISNKSKKVKDLYYVGGNTTPGIGLPMCLIGAELIYKRLAGDKKGGAVEKIKPLTHNNN